LIGARVENHLGTRRLSAIGQGESTRTGAPTVARASATSEASEATQRVPRDSTTTWSTATAEGAIIAAV
jgi:hypothetical protein